MTTLKSNKADLLNYLDRRLDGDPKTTAQVIYKEGDLQIWRIVSQQFEGWNAERNAEQFREDVEYLSTTHWGGGGALQIRGGQPHWSSGGTVADATPWQLCEVMAIVWSDARQRVGGKTAQID